MKKIVLLLVIAMTLVNRGFGGLPEDGHAKYATGDFAGAVADFTKAIQLKPADFASYIARGDAKYKTADPRGALADYNKAIELKPDLNQPHDLAQTPEAVVTNEIAKQALALFQNKDYDQLDAIAVKLRASKERYADGVWKLACVYDGLVPSNRASDEEWETRISGIGRWSVAKPDSITPLVAWANVLVAYAWQIRGAGEADTVSSLGRRLFQQRLTRALKILKDANALQEKCPLYWRVVLRAALGSNLDKARFDAVFNRAVKSEPDCECFYFRRVIFLLPRWHGTEGEWQSDLISTADKLGGEEGDMLYAQVIWNLNQPSYFKNPFFQDNVSWMRVDKGFEAIEKRFPESLAAKIERAQLAIQFKHTQAAVYYNQGIDEKKKGDLESALTDYSKAIAIDPDYAMAYHGRGNVRQTRGDLAGALADFDAAIKSDPDYALGYYGRGTVKQSQMDFAGAIADYSMAIKLKPDLAAFYTARGYLKQREGDSTGAQADFKAAGDLNSKTR